VALKLFIIPVLQRSAIERRPAACSHLLYRGRSSKEFRMSAPDQQDTATDNQDATDPNNLLYYAPRHLRDRANALRTKQFDGQALEIRTAPSLDPQIPDEPPEFLPERPLTAPEPGSMEAVWRLSQRARKRQVLGPALRFAGVAGLAAGLATTYVVIFTEVPDRNAVNEVAATPKALVSKVADESVIESKPTENVAAKIDEPESVGVKVSTLNPVDLTTPSLPAATPEENAALFREFLRWQETSAQRDTPTVRPNAAATREAPPRRKRKARRRHVDDE
jgi:hypothetical protein